MNCLQIGVGVILYSLFFLTCYLSAGTDEKNMGGFRSYPDEVQKIVRENAALKELAPKKLSVPITFLSNIILFTVIFSIFICF